MFYLLALLGRRIDTRFFTVFLTLPRSASRFVSWEKRGIHRLNGSENIRL
jgi:hypothetical protein